MKIKHLFFLIDSLENGAGTERIAVDVSNSLCALGHSITWIVASNNKESFFKLHPSILIYSIYSKSKSRRRDKLFELLMRKRPDYLINVAIQQLLLSFIPCIKSKTKMIAWEHFFYGGGHILGNWMRLFSVIVCDKTITLTKDDKNNYPRFFQGKIIVIPNFTMIDRWIPNQKINRRHVIVSAGRLEKEHKAMHLLIDAWSKVHDKKDWIVEIYGDGPEYENLQTQIYELRLLDSVFLKGKTNNIPTLFLSSGIYALPSRLESFGLVLLEAKAMGLPTVAFNCPYGPKNIIRNGIDGYLVEPGLIDDFALKLQLLMNDEVLRESMGAAALKDYKENWRSELIVEKWIQLIND